MYQFGDIPYLCQFLAMWSPCRLNAQVEFADIKPVICLTVCTTPSLCHSEILSVLPSHYDIVNEMPVFVARVHLWCTVCLATEYRSSRKQVHCDALSRYENPKNGSARSRTQVSHWSLDLAGSVLKEPKMCCMKASTKKCSFRVDTKENSIQRTAYEITWSIDGDGS